MVERDSCVALDALRTQGPLPLPQPPEGSAMTGHVPLFEAAVASLTRYFAALLTLLSLMVSAVLLT